MEFTPRIIVVIVTLVFVFARNITGRITASVTSNPIDTSHPQSAGRVCSNYNKGSSLTKCFEEASKACRQSVLCSTNGGAYQRSFRPKRKNRSSVDIKVRLYEPGNPMHLDTYQYQRLQAQVKEQKLNQDVKIIQEFESLFGPRTNVIRDPQGNIRGFQSMGPSSDISTGISQDSDKGEDQWESIQGDQDICCSTVKYYFVNATLVDVHQKTHTLNQYNNSGSSQFIPHGVCGKKGLCQETCVQAYTPTTLSIYVPNGNQKIKFSLFNIPSYCSCRSIA